MTDYLSGHTFICRRRTYQDYDCPTCGGLVRVHTLPEVRDQTGAVRHRAYVQETHLLVSGLVREDCPGTSQG